jgi:hypothetical protein
MSMTHTRPRGLASTTPKTARGGGQSGQTDRRIACLDALATELGSRGWTAYLAAPAGRLACLMVEDPREAAEPGSVVAATDVATGDWWYWFGWAERIGPASAPGQAAEAVIAALRPPADPSGGPSAGKGRL